MLSRSLTPNSEYQTGGPTPVDRRLTPVPKSNRNYSTPCPEAGSRFSRAHSEIRYCLMTVRESDGDILYAIWATGEVKGVGQFGVTLTRRFCLLHTAINYLKQMSENGSDPVDTD